MRFDRSLYWIHLSQRSTVCLDECGRRHQFDSRADAGNLFPGDVEQGWVGLFVGVSSCLPIGMCSVRVCESMTVADRVTQFAGVSIMTTSSRMVYAFARDRGLPASPFFAKVHPRLQVPLNALWLTTILVIIFGCIFLGSSSAFNAIVSASVVALGITYAIPPAINCLRGRRMLPESRPFILPAWLGWTCNLVRFPNLEMKEVIDISKIGIAYVILTTVLFMFPPVSQVTGSNMNYCVAAFAIVLIISTIQWFIDGRKNYTGPQIDIDALKAGEIVGMAPEGEGNGLEQSRSDPVNGNHEKKAEI